MESMTAEGVARARRTLMRRDPVLAAIIKRHGECGLLTARGPDIFNGLIQSIISQQLSTKAAATIYKRFLALLPDPGNPAPHHVLPLEDAALRTVGLSRQKISYLRDLSRRVDDGSLQTEALATLGDDDVIAALTQVKGVGRWTAEMILIFRLLRPDVLPVGDLGIGKAIQNAYGLRKTPDAKRMLKIAEPWRPYRSVASWYLWKSLENRPPTVAVTSRK
jgi:DNA-3-methyladenine glycosylase II